MPQALAVAEHEHHLARPEIGHEGVDQRLDGAFAARQYGSDRVRHQVRCLGRRQLDQPHPVGEVVCQTIGRQERQLDLATAAGYGQGSSTRPRAEQHQVADRGAVVLASDQRTVRCGQVVSLGGGPTLGTMAVDQERDGC